MPQFRELGSRQTLALRLIGSYLVLYPLFRLLVFFVSIEAQLFIGYLRFPLEFRSLHDLLDLHHEAIQLFIQLAVLPTKLLMLCIPPAYLLLQNGANLNMSFG